MNVETYAEMTEGMDPRSLVAYKHFIPAEFVNVGCINFYDDGTDETSSCIYGYNPENDTKTYLSGKSALVYLENCFYAGVLCINNGRIIDTKIVYDADDNTKAIGEFFYDGIYTHFVPLVAGTRYSKSAKV